MNPRALPSAKQLAFQNLEFGLFLHFGLRTFYPGHRDFDGQAMSPQKFDPTALDCDQWVRVAAESGVRYMVLTAKHHDGFANWPSKFTEFSVASSPWKNGGGDVIREFTDACARHGMKAGLYYSPVDGASPVYADSAAYDQFFIDQISELMGNYGEISVVWFDSCGSGDHQYDWPRIIRAVRELQPNILIFHMSDEPDYRWVGNEDGFAPAPCFNTATELPANEAQPARALPAPKWLPFECDCRMRETNWFYEDDDEHTIKSLDELLGLYYLSVGRGCNLLINIGPNPQGLLPAKDAARLQELGSEIERRFGQPLSTLADCEASENVWTWRPDEPTLIDHAIIEEEIALGESVKSFRLEIGSAHQKMPITVYEGHTIGHKAICRFPAVRTREVRLVVTESDGEVRLRALNFYSVAAKA